MYAPSISLLRALRSIVLKPMRSVPKSQVRLTRLAKQSGTCSFATEPRMAQLLQCRSLTTSARHNDPPQSSSTHQPSTPYPVARTRERNPHAPTHHDRGPASTEDTQTDFGKMDILGMMNKPATSVDACVPDGFHLDNGVKVLGGHGVLLLSGEAFQWSPWSSGSIGDLLDKKGVLELSQSALGVLEMIYPKPDLLLIGTGARLWMLGKETRKSFSQMGIRVDVMDTANAASAYNLLATERGVETVGAAFLPVGWKGNV